jgi:NAD(P)H-hydrate repair Nnr-like enzyme with NAD(P)H-hydrate dehydratase domain
MAKLIKANQRKQPTHTQVFVAYGLGRPGWLKKEIRELASSGGGIIVIDPDGGFIDRLNQQDADFLDD